MQIRRAVAIAMLVSLAAAGCSSDGSDSAGTPRQAEIPNQPAGRAGKAFCDEFSETLISAAVDSPFRSYDAVVLNDFPAPGVDGFECQWEWLNPDGDQRNVKVDVLNFGGALEGSLDASWKQSTELVDPVSQPLENLGEDAITVKAAGLVTVSTRAGQRQVTVVGSSQGSVAPPSRDAMVLIASEALDIEM